MLSVHDQFAYAQRGMKLGVIDYLLKPVKKDVLYKAIDKAIQGIADDGRSKDDRMNWSLMQQLIAAEAPETGTAAPLAQRRCGLALLQIDNKPGPAGSGDDACAGRRAAALKSHFRHPRLEGQELHCLTIDAKRKVFLAPVPDDCLAEAFRSGLRAMHESLLRLGMQAHIPYAFKEERERLNQSYDALLRRFEAQMLFGQSTWIEPPVRNEKIRQANLAAAWEKVRVLQTHLKQGDVRKGRETIRKLGDELRARAVTVKQLKLFVNDRVFVEIQPRGVGARRDQPGQAAGGHQHPERVATYEQLTGWLADRAFALVGERRAGRPESEGLVPVLLNWIHANYSHELSLQQFAFDNHVSLGYLSRLFKSQIGLTFSEYVIRHRIAKAKELLDEGDARLSDVRSLVGYEDAKHFSELFKKSSASGLTRTQSGKRKIRPLLSDKSAGVRSSRFPLLLV